MANSHRESLHCACCGKTFPISGLVASSLVRAPVAELIRTDHPGWSDESHICLRDLAEYRARYVEQALARDRGELGQLEQDVVASLRQHELLAENINQEFDTQLTFGERLADRVASFGGSWTFILSFGGVLVGWIVMNSVQLLSRPFDPFPFILLNLVLSCLAALQAPVIMMSQNRQEAKDRLRAEHDYQVNLKAELEIRHLHAKLDQMLTHQWQRLLEIQQLQVDLLEELAKRRAP